MTIGEALVRYLETKKVEVIFGIPGVHTVELYRGLSRSRIRHITSRHEQGAGFMADGYARVSGKPARVLGISRANLFGVVAAICLYESEIMELHMMPIDQKKTMTYIKRSQVDRIVGLLLTVMFILNSRVILLLSY